MTLAAIRRGAPQAIFEGRSRQFLIDLVAYAFVSVLALACDYGLLVGLVAYGLHYLVASLISFSVGMLVSYALCIHFVFAARRATSRKAEALGFFAVGIAGLALTQVLLYLFVKRCGLPVALAKIPTTGLVFFFNFLCRRGLVFASGMIVRPKR